MGPTIRGVKQSRAEAQRAQRRSEEAKFFGSSTFSAESMQLADRRRLGGSRRGQSARAILPPALLVHLSVNSLNGGKYARPPRLDGVSRRDGGSPTASFRFSGQICWQTRG